MRVRSIHGSSRKWGLLMSAGLALPDNAVKDFRSWIREDSVVSGQPRFHQIKMLHSVAWKGGLELAWGRGCRLPPSSSSAAGLSRQ